MNNVKDIKKIDIHAHATLFPELVPPFPSSGENILGAEDVTELYDKLGIERGVLLPTVSPDGSTVMYSNESCKTIADQKPDRFLWFCNIDPRYGDTSSPEKYGKVDFSYYLNHYKALGAKGFGELTARLYADDPLMDNLFYHCAQCDMPVTIHISPGLNYNYGIVDDLGLPRLERMLKKHPGLKLLGHSQPFWAEMSADITEEKRCEYPIGKVTEGRLPKLMREYGNLYCDLSAGSGANALMRDPEYAARFMEEFSDRILYGVDYCVKSTTYQFTFNDFLNRMVADGMLSTENYRKIVRGNVLKLLKLEE